MPNKFPCHSLNFGTVAAIFINEVSRHSKLGMHYRRRPFIALPVGKNVELAFVFGKRYEVGEKENYKVEERYRFGTK